jgi:hypothetical protein
MNKTYDQSNLQQRWIQVLRAKNKSSSTLICSLCELPFRGAAEILVHLDKEHAAPTDAKAVALLRERISSSARGISR